MTTPRLFRAPAVMGEFAVSSDLHRPLEILPTGGVAQVLLGGADRGQRMDTQVVETKPICHLECLLCMAQTARVVTAEHLVAGRPRKHASDAR